MEKPDRPDLGMITLINPNLMLQKDDLFTTGIVYMPVGAAYFASALRDAGFAASIVDAFGEAPNQYSAEGRFLYRGLKPAEVVDRLAPENLAIGIYAINLTYHQATVRIVQAVRARFPDLPIVVFENTQAVTAYALKKVQSEFYDAGATFVLTGESEIRGVSLMKAIAQKASREQIAQIDGVGFRTGDRVQYSEPKEKIQELDALSFPAWDLFPLENYWKLGYSHGPLSSDRYLPLLTSRGCPYACRFCVIPETNNLKWRSRSASNVVAEMEYMKRRFGVSEFHIEDVDPTVSDKRIQEFCRELIQKKSNFIWKICSGTKVETIRSEETLQLMAQAGCRYISISPESGSPRVMKLINKPFNLDHALRLIRKMNEVGIRSQACFVLGFPGEEDEDRRLTWQMAKRLTQNGLDEIAIFVITPVPGSAIFDKFSGYSDYSQLHFSPTWRKDYQKLNEFRLKLYRSFLLWKLRYHPIKIGKQPFNFLARRFETKMEMAPFRALHTAVFARKASSS